MSHSLIYMYNIGISRGFLLKTDSRPVRCLRRLYLRLSLSFLTLNTSWLLCCAFPPITSHQYIYDNVLHVKHSHGWLLVILTTRETNAIMLMLCLIIMSPSHLRPDILAYETVFVNQSINDICIYLGDRMFYKGLETSNCTTNGTTVRRAIHCSIPSPYKCYKSITIYHFCYPCVWQIHYIICIIIL